MAFLRAVLERAPMAGDDEDPRHLSGESAEHLREELQRRQYEIEGDVGHEEG